jgi:hypothetical protein
MRRALVLALVAASVLTLGACSPKGDSGPTPTKTETARFSLHDQEQLSEALSTAAAQHGWAGGCLWPAGTTRSLRDALTQIGIADAGVRLSRRETASGAVIVIGVRDERPSTSASFDEVSGADFLCMRPGASAAPRASA